MTQDDIDAGEIVNVITANATSERGENPDEVSATATVKAEDAKAKLAITKEADPTEDVAVGDTINYTVVATNTGNVSVKAGTLEDDHADLSGETFELAPEESVTFEYTYTVTQDDIDAGEIVNVVTANAEAERGEAPDEVSATATVKAEDAEAKLDITKEANPNEDVAAGDTITYTVVVTNIGNVTVKTGSLVDDHADLSGKTFELAPEASATFEYTYTVTQDDIDAGEIVNVVTANATAERGDDPEEAEASATAEAEEATSTLSITKSANVETVKAAGEIITYTVVVTNEGNVSVKSGKLEDDHADLSSETFELAPEESVTFIYSYEVTQADMDAGEIVNVVKADAETVRGENPEEVSATVTVTAEQKGHLTVVKETVSEPAEGGTYALGETITYTITVTNDGNLTITDITVTDERTGLSETIPAMAPGEVKEFTTTTTVTEDDILSGHIINDATVTGTSPDPDDVDGVPNEPGHTDDEPDDLDTELSVNKQITNTPKDGEAYQLGETIEYKITIKNEGNVTYKNVVIEDDLTKATKTVAELGVGEETFLETSYTVTEADILAGSVKNTAIAKGDEIPDPKDPENPKTPEGEDSTKTGDKDDPDGPTPPIATPDPSLSVKKKTTSTPKSGTTYELGETITYTITVTNDGNLTIRNIELTDSVKGYEEEDISDKLEKTELAPGEKTSVTFEHVVTEQDILAGTVKNSATADGSNESDDPTDPGDDETEDEPDDLDTELSVNKQITNKPENGGAYQLGETIEYRITVKNEGNVTYKNVVIEDDLTKATKTVAELGVGEETILETSYTVTEADILAGSVKNTATAKGDEIPDPKDPENPKAPEGEDTTETGDEDDPDGPTPPITDPDGHITVTKKATSTPANGSSYGLEETITYEIVAENDGNLTITDITVKDDLTGSEWTITSLAPGSSESFETSYSVTEDDTKAGHVLNVATAEGTNPDPDPRDPTPGTEDVPTVGHMTIVKTTTSTPANGETYALDEVITYQITATNDGKADLKNITVTDDLTGDTWRIATLAAGASQTFTTSYTVTEQDILNGSVRNEATATGKDDDGNPPVIIPDDTEDPTDEKNSHLKITKTVSSTPVNGTAYEEGETVSYNIRVENDGNMTITDITVKDDLTGESWKIATLAPGVTMEIMNTSYVVTAADAAGGHVLNVATVEGTDPEDEPVNNDDDVDVPAANGLSLTVVKVWNDAGRAARPASLTMTLIGGNILRTVTLNADNNWTATVTNLPEHMPDGTMITYRWFEPAVTGYTQTSSVTTGNTTTITNTREAAPAAATYQLTVHYRYMDGSEAAPDVNLQYAAGTAYDVASPTITGYTATPLHVTGTMPRRNVEVTVLYLPGDNTEIIDEFETPLGLGQVFVNAGECVE